jgi:hypothetical protein
VSVESDYVFVVENLLTKELKAARATHLRFYQDSKLDVTAELYQTSIATMSRRRVEDVRRALQ